jgi:type VI protein secretion system component VasK
MAQRMLHTAQILWPAFLIAGVIEMVVFSWIDPSLLHTGSWQPDRQTVYSLAFLIFWALVAVASGLSHWMMASGSDQTDHSRARRHAARRPHLHHPA